MVDGFIVVKVKNAFKRIQFQLGGVNVGSKCLGLIQCGLIANIQFIDQHRGTRIAIILDRINAVRLALCSPGKFGKTLQEFCGSSFSMQNTRTLLPHLRCHSIPLHAGGGLGVFHGNSIILISQFVHTKRLLIFR